MSDRLRARLTAAIADAQPRVTAALDSLELAIGGVLLALAAKRELRKSLADR